MLGTKVRLDVETEWLAEEIRRLLAKIDYPLKFEVICISESCKVDFLKGDAKSGFEVWINPTSETLDNRRIFRGYFARMVFLLINEKEGLNEAIKQALDCPRLVPQLQDFFADFKAVKYGFGELMDRFFIEKVTGKIYSKELVTKKEFAEYYLHYLALKKNKRGEEFGNIALPLKPEGMDNLLAELDKLSYPFRLGDKALVKEWSRVLYDE